MTKKSKRRFPKWQIFPNDPMRWFKKIFRLRIIFNESLQYYYMHKTNMQRTNIHPDLAGGYPTWIPPQQGTPSRVPPPDLAAGYPTWVPQQGTPSLAGYPSWQGTPPASCTWLGNPPPRCLPHGILGNVAKHYGIWVPPPPGVDWQTKWNYYLPVVLRTQGVMKRAT